jgi:hypothetical protein
VGAIPAERFHRQKQIVTVQSHLKWWRILKNQPSPQGLRQRLAMRWWGHLDTVPGFKKRIHFEWTG